MVFEVTEKGFFSDSVISIAQMDLSDLETNCTIEKNLSF